MHPGLPVPLYINARILGKPRAGVQQCLLETLPLLRLPYTTVAPKRYGNGAAGHLWEQTILPRLVGDGLLWSPSHTGPLSVRRQVVTIHDALSFDYPELLSPRFSRWYRFLVPRVGQRVHWVITDSEFSRQRLQQLGIVGDNISVIYPGVNAAFGAATDEDAAAAASALKLPTKKYVLSLSSLAKYKNVQRLLEAWERLAPRLPSDYWLVLAGAAGAARIYGDTSLGKVPPRTFFTGRVPQPLLPGLYRGAQAFAFPSLYEGFGLPPLEAMAAGVPVLTANCAAMPEIAGDAALQVDPTETGAIAAGLEQLLLNERVRERLQRAGPERAREFTWERCARQTAAVLSRAANS